MLEMYANGDVERVRAFITEYVWSFDMADIDTVVAMFEEDALFQDSAGNEYIGKNDILGYFSGLIKTSGFRGRRHHIDNLRIKPTDDGYSIQSYWTVTKWQTGKDRRFVEIMGHSFDRLVRNNTGFKFAERRIFYWRDSDCPWFPDGTAI